MRTNELEGAQNYPHDEEEERMVISDRKRRILLEDDSKEMTIFFNPDDYAMTKDEAAETAQRLSWNGYCTGKNTERFLSGEVKFFFNPITQGIEDRTRVAMYFIEAIKATEN